MISEDERRAQQREIIARLAERFIAGSPPGRRLRSRQLAQMLDKELTRVGLGVRPLDQGVMDRGPCFSPTCGHGDVDHRPECRWCGTADTLRCFEFLPGPSFAVAIHDAG